MKTPRNQKGVAAIVFVIIFPFFFGFFALAIEGTRYLTDSAHLSDVAESASLAVAASVEHRGDRQRIRDYLAATIPDANISDDNITITSQSCEEIYGQRCGQAGVYDKEGLRFNEYKVTLRSSFISWFPDSDIIHGFEENQQLANTAVARKYQQEFVDVVFVTDMSGSMLDGFGGQQKAKYAGVIDIIDSIMDTLDSYNAVAARSGRASRNHVGLVPYSGFNQAINEDRLYDLSYVYNYGWGRSIDGPHQENVIAPSFTPEELQNEDKNLHRDAPNGVLRIADATPDKRWMQIYFEWYTGELMVEQCYPPYGGRGRPPHQNCRFVSTGETWSYDDWNYDRRYDYWWEAPEQSGVLNRNLKIRNYIGCSNYTAYTDWRNNCTSIARSGSAGYTGYFYNLDLTDQFSDIKKQIANFFPSGSTSSSQGVIPAAQMLLNKSSDNEDNLIIVLSDGADNNNISREYYRNGLCDYLREQFTNKNQTLKIAVIGFDYNTNDNPGLAMCADSNEILTANSYTEIYNSILSLITEEIGHLYDHNYSADE